MATIQVKYIDTTKYVARIRQDEYPESPREWDNLGTMVCSHRDYNLGDEQLNASEYDGWDEVKQSLIEERDARIILPLGLYDHSGITMYIGDRHDRWDGGQVGFIYVSAETLRREYGVKRITKKTLRLAENALRCEVEMYDMYLRGDVYTVTIETEHGKEVDSCSGIYGSDGVEEYIKDIIGDAKYEEVTE